MIRGFLIVIEGVDGAGTTTHTRLLRESIRSTGYAVQTTRQPSDGPIGTQIRQVLTGRLVVPGMNGLRPFSWNTMALLFAADRLDHQEATIQPNMREGVTVLCDRYYYSSLAYQSITGGDTDEIRHWVKEINRWATKPDLTIVLDVSPEETSRRRRERDLGRELYDDDDLQVELARFYKEIDKHFPNDPIVHVNGERSVNDVAKEIKELVTKFWDTAKR